MSKAGFMSMRWLRLHLKEIIWATVILFVLSCFIIGLGTSRAQRAADDRQKKADAAERKAKDAEEAMPENIKAKQNLPAIHLSYNGDNASLTRVIDLKTVFGFLSGTEHYKKVAAAPKQLRAAFIDQLLEQVIQHITDSMLLGMYAEAKGIKPLASAQELVAQDKARIGPPQFEQELRKRGLTTGEYAAQRYQQELIQSVVKQISAPVPAASATDAAIEKYYEDHKIRFKKDDEITVKHLLVSPGDFMGKAEVQEAEMRRYYEEHRQDFMSPERVSVRHILINPNAPDFLKLVDVTDTDVQRYYSDHLDQYKKAEEAKARHILIRPKNQFEKQSDNFTVTFSQFKLDESGEKEAVYSFNTTITDRKSGTNLKASDIVVSGSDDKSYSPTAESLAKVEGALELPIGGTPSKAPVTGPLAVLLPKGVTPVKLTVRDGGTSHNFDVAPAHNEDLAFAAAEAELASIVARIKDGADFSKVAEEASEDPGSKKNGGDLGFFKRGQMVKEFEDVAFSGKLNEVSAPVKTQFGWHVLKVEERRPARTQPIDEVRTEILAALKKQRAVERATNDLEMWRELVTQKSRTFAELAEKYSMGASKKAGGKLPVFFKGDFSDNYPAELASDMAILEAEVAMSGQVLPEIEEAVYALQPNEMSPVVKTSKGLHLFQLESKLPPVQLSFGGNVKNRVRDIVDEQRRKVLAKEKAEALAKVIPTGNFDEIAKEYKADFPTTLGPLPFSVNAGFSNYGLSQAIGQLSLDGRTYLPALHVALTAAFKKAQAKDGPWDKPVGPVETDLGYHFFVLTNASFDKYTPLAEVKEKLVQMLVQEPSEADLKKAFEQNVEKFDKPATRKVRQILVSEEEVAKDVHKRLVEGEIFHLLAQRYSTDGYSQVGGLMGDMKKGQLPANLDELVWKLKKGEFTPPVQTSYGWVIMQLDQDEAPGQKATLTPEIRDQLRKHLRQNYQNMMVESFLEELRNRSQIIRHPEVLAEL